MGWTYAYIYMCISHIWLPSTQSQILTAHLQCCVGQEHRQPNIHGCRLPLPKPLQRICYVVLGKNTISLTYMAAGYPFSNPYSAFATLCWARKPLNTQLRQLHTHACTRVLSGLRPFMKWARLCTASLQTDTAMIC